MRRVTNSMPHIHPRAALFKLLFTQIAAPNLDTSVTCPAQVDGATFVGSSEKVRDLAPSSELRLQCCASTSFRSMWSFSPMGDHCSVAEETSGCDMPIANRLAAAGR